MSDKQEGASPAPPKKSSKMVLIIVVVVGLACVVGGVFIGPKFGTKLHIPGYHEQQVPKDEVPPAAGIFTLEPCVIDIRNKEGETHHLKAGIAVELNVKIPEKEMEGVIPRARDAAITYLRSLDYERAVSQEEFEKIRGELDVRIKKAIGERFVARILFTEFVVQ